MCYGYAPGLAVYLHGSARTASLDGLCDWAGYRLTRSSGVTGVLMPVL